MLFCNNFSSNAIYIHGFACVRSQSAGTWKRWEPWLWISASTSHIHGYLRIHNHSMPRGVVNTLIHRRGPHSWYQTTKIYPSQSRTETKFYKLIANRDDQAVSLKMSVNLLMRSVLTHICTQINFFLQFYLLQFKSQLCVGRYGQFSRTVLLSTGASIWDK